MLYIIFKKYIFAKETGVSKRTWVCAGIVILLIILGLCSGLAILFKDSSSTHPEASSTDTTTESDTRDSRFLFSPTDTGKEENGMASVNTPKLSIIVAIVMKKRGLRFLFNAPPNPQKMSYSQKR